MEPKKAAPKMKITYPKINFGKLNKNKNRHKIDEILGKTEELKSVICCIVDEIETKDELKRSHTQN